MFLVGEKAQFLQSEGQTYFRGTHKRMALLITDTLKRLGCVWSLGSSATDTNTWALAGCELLSFTVIGLDSLLDSDATQDECQSVHKFRWSEAHCTRHMSSQIQHCQQGSQQSACTCLGVSAREHGHLLHFMPSWQHTALCQKWPSDVPVHQSTSRL